MHIITQKLLPATDSIITYLCVCQNCLSFLILLTLATNLVCAHTVSQKSSFLFFLLYPTFCFRTPQCSFAFSTLMDTFVCDFYTWPEAIGIMEMCLKPLVFCSIQDVRILHRQHTTTVPPETVTGYQPPAVALLQNYTSFFHLPAGVFTQLSVFNCFRHIVGCLYLVLLCIAALPGGKGGRENKREVGCQCMVGV